MSHPFRTPATAAAFTSIGLVLALHLAPDRAPLDCPAGTQPIQSARAHESGRYCSKPVVRNGQDVKAPDARARLRGPVPRAELMEAALAQKSALEPLKASIPKANGQWQEYGKGPLIAFTRAVTRR